MGNLDTVEITKEEYNDLVSMIKGFEFLISHGSCKVFTEFDISSFGTSYRFPGNNEYVRSSIKGIMKTTYTVTQGLYNSYLDKKK